MNIQDWGKLSIGEWIAIRRGWDKAHGQNIVSAPTEEEFDAAVRAVRRG